MSTTAMTPTLLASPSGPPLPVTARQVLEQAVSTGEAAAALGVSPSYMTALKRAMGVKGRFVYVSLLNRWRKEHPEFTSKVKRPAARPSPRTRRRNLVA
jgi:hypothetical protein